MTLDRTKSIGGSDVAAILGISPWRTRLDVWREKALGDLDAKTSPAMEAGLRMEPAIIHALNAKMQAEDKDARIARALPVVRGHRHASPDAVAERRGWLTLVEIKTTSSTDGWGPDGSDEIPDHYLVQVQHYLDVLELEDAIVPVLFWPSDMRSIAGLTTHEVVEAVGLKTYRLTWSRVIAEQIREACAKFWREHVEPKNPPAAVSLEDAKRCAFAVNGKAISVTEQIAKLIERRDDLRQDIATMDSHVEAIEFELRELMGDAEVALGSGGKPVVSCKVIERAGYTAQVKPTRYRSLTVAKNWRNNL